MSADRRSPEMWPSGYGQGFWNAAGDRPDGDGPEADTGLAGVAEPAQRYAVRDTTGRLWATLVREPNKVFWWEGPDGRPGLGDVSVVDLPLYGSERLRRVGLETPVILTEGPKDCEAVWRAGLPCIGTVTGAAATPSITVLEVLWDRIVILWPDNDEPGVRHMEKVAEALDGMAREIRWLQIPGLGPKAGAADVATAEIARLVESYARVTRPRVSTDSTSLREKGESPSSSRVSLEATYAREVSTKRYGRAELAELRKSVQVRFNAPSDTALGELIDALQRIQGRLVRPRQIDYLIRCYRIHGPGTVRLLTELYGGGARPRTCSSRSSWPRPYGRQPIRTTSRPPPALPPPSRTPFRARPGTSRAGTAASTSVPATCPNAAPMARSSAAPATRGRSDERRLLLGLRPGAADLVEIGPADMQLGVSDEALARRTAGR